MTNQKSLLALIFVLALALLGAWAVGLLDGGAKDSLADSATGVAKQSTAAVNLYPERKRVLKGVVGNNHPGLFADYHRDIRTRPGEPGPSYPPNYRVKELLKARALPSTTHLLQTTRPKQNQLNWVERGPGNVSGRTRGLLVDPDDQSYNTWYAGSVGGGVWKTDNAGHNWVELTRGLPNLATSTLAMAASNPDVIYVGTGEGFLNIDQINGSGIWKSKDRGATWQQLEYTANHSEFQNVTRLIVDPEDEQTLLASTVPGIHHSRGQRPNSGIFRSEDGGQSWVKVHDAGSDRVEQILYNPKNFRTQYATVRGVGVLKSLDAGKTWHDASTGLVSVQRMEMTVSPVDTLRLYLSAESGSSGSTLFVSENGADSWFSGQSVSGPDVDWLAGQGWYDNTIAAHPFDVNRLFVGGVNLWEMEVLPGLDSSEAEPTGVDLENTSTFLTFIDFGGELAGGGIAIGTAELDEFSTVEIRFGVGKKQMAHRFTVPPGATSGVPDSDYTYQDYVEVPFEFWDVDNNRRLMVSFRDQTNNGQWELQKFDSNTSREYLFLHSVPYEESPSGSIAQNAGHTFRQLYFLWPVLPENGVWDADNLPEATLRINFGKVISKRMAVANVTDGYGQFGGSTKGVHVDHHNVLLLPTSEVEESFRLLNANDGGVSVSDNGGLTFQQRLNGYNTTQFYGVDKKNGAHQYIGGMQDNSTWMSPSGNPDAASQWFFVLGGDGFECVWNYRDSRKILASAQFNSIF
ncbi:hypothetical protein MJD09_12470, partial [bacterium]|nr:hypothetical protein [bacterium]